MIALGVEAVLLVLLLAELAIGWRSYAKQAKELSTAAVRITRRV